MSDLRAEPLSPIDATTLWPQLRRLTTEVIATRSNENLLVKSGLAASGLGKLPRMPRTAVLGVHRGLSYRGVVAARELAGGVAWEAVSLRLNRETDDEVVTALLAACAIEVARRGGRALYLRCAEGSPHLTAVRRGGLFSYRAERMFVRHTAHDRSRNEGLAEGSQESAGTGDFRAAGRHDRNGVFRLYCRVAPEHVRRNEALTQQEWRALMDANDSERNFVLERDGVAVAWLGVGEREAHVLADTAVAGVTNQLLNMVESEANPEGILVLSDFQEPIERAATERGYTYLGERLLFVRRLAALIPMKETATAPVDPAVTPQLR